MGPSAPDLRISVSCQDRLIVTLTKPNEEPRPFLTRLTPVNMSQFRTAFYFELDKFWQLVGVGLTVQDFKIVSEAMRHLHSMGAQLTFEIFGLRRYDLEQYFVTAFPTWRRSATPGYRAPMIEVISRFEHLLPLEFLPLFDTTELPEIQTIDDLALAAARFLGFSTLIHRVFLRGSDSKSIDMDDAILHNVPRLGIRFFQHAGLAGTREECAFFKNAEWAELRGPWPDEPLDEAQFVSQLAAQLWQATTPTTQRTQDRPDEIHHFSCHCDTDRTDYREYSLYLAHKKDIWPFLNSEKRATIGSLEKKFGSFLPRPSDAHPVIFFNACGASKLTPSDVTSFPDLFLEIGSRGVIGSETRVPDPFAAAFSKQFYRNFVYGHPLGEAIYNARWSLLKIHKNPLGILYAAYGNPDVRVWKPVNESFALRT